MQRQPTEDRKVIAYARPIPRRVEADVKGASGSAHWPVALSVVAALAGVVVGVLAFRQRDVYLGTIGLACGVAGTVLAGRGGALPKRLWLLGVLGSSLAVLLGLGAVILFK